MLIWKRGWMDFPREKTGVERRAKLMPETVDSDPRLFKTPQSAGKRISRTIFSLHPKARLGRIQVIGQ